MYQVIASSDIWRLAEASRRGDLLHEARDSHGGFLRDALELLNPAGFGRSRLIMTVDVFDTLLMRSGHSEQCRFSSLSAKIAEELGRTGLPRDAGDLHLSRLLAFGAQASAVPKWAREPRLVDVLNRQVSLLDLPRHWAQEFWRMEIESERQSLSVNPFVLALVREQMRRGGLVILASDGYFSPQDIQLLLVTHAPELAFRIPITTSSWLGASKATGKLFGTVLAELVGESLGTCLTCHVGDQKYEIQMAEMAGIDFALWLPLVEQLDRQRRDCHAVCRRKFADIVHASGWDEGQYR